MQVLAHATHWLQSAAYAAPVLALPFAVLAARFAERRAAGS